MFLSLISTDLCMIIHYTVEKNIFVVIVYMLQKKYLSVISKTALTLFCKQTIKMPKKGEYVKSKNFKRKIKSPFMIYADFKSILVPEDNGNQNPNHSYTNKYQKNVACSYGYKLVCVDDKFS